MPFNKALLQLTMNLNANDLESSNSAKKKAPKRGLTHLKSRYLFILNAFICGK
ncbi:MAG: hypothetical protein ACI9KR_000416 [Arcticibacterium sp.]|jgi:hypothetical protein